MAARSEWWHGGPKFSGNLLLPPSTTGVPSLLSELGARADVDAVRDDSSVYLINSIQLATIFAAGHRDPWVYNCIPLTDLRIDPDYANTTHSNIQSMRCDRAMIVRRLKPSNDVIAHARSILAAAG